MLKTWKSEGEENENSLTLLNLEGDFTTDFCNLINTKHNTVSIKLNSWIKVRCVFPIFIHFQTVNGMKNSYSSIWILINLQIFLGQKLLSTTVWSQVIKHFVENVNGPKSNGMHMTAFDMPYCDYVLHTGYVLLTGPKWFSAFYIWLSELERKFRIIYAFHSI